jgi:hypothetical protein
MIMFTKFELETVIIMILTINDDKWFTKQCLFDEVSKYYPNSDELYYGHFLFIWTKLLSNSNFISIHPTKEKIKIKTNDSENKTFENFNENQIDVIHDMNLQVQLKHIIDYPKLYNGSGILKSFLLNNYDCDFFFKFFYLYQRILSFKENKYVVPSNYYYFLNKIKYPTTISLLILAGYYYFIKK